MDRHRLSTAPARLAIAAMLTLCSLGSQAALFEDDEARRAVLDLPTLRPAATDNPEDVVVRVHQGVARKGKSRAWINAVLFVLTLISTLFAGALYSSAVTQVQSPWEFISPGFLLNGLPE